MVAADDLGRARVPGLVLSTGGEMGIIGILVVVILVIIVLRLIG